MASHDPVHRFAQSDLEAEARYERFEQVDPFPSIPPSLLNSADLSDYVAATGMVWPYYEDAEHLKPASYKIALEGEYIVWDETAGRQSDSLEKGQPFTLKANSIAFVTLEPMFRVPLYIALRFNLRIKHIYRGILLGTGPLVDPGFVGRLSVPLHNLTTNDYEFLGGEELIWMEFTKLSPSPVIRPASRKDGPQRAGTLFQLPTRKRSNLTVVDYVHAAADGRPIRSSIPDAIEEARAFAEEATASSRASAAATNRTRRFISAALLVALILGLASAVGVVLSTYSLFNSATSRIDALYRTAASPQPSSKVQSQIGELHDEVNRLQGLLYIAFPTSIAISLILVLAIWGWTGRRGGATALEPGLEERAPP